MKLKKQLNLRLFWELHLFQFISVTSCIMCFFHRCPAEHVCSTFPTWQHSRLNSQIIRFAESLSFAITFCKMTTENILTSTIRSSYPVVYIFHTYIYKIIICIHNLEMNHLEYYIQRIICDCFYCGSYPFHFDVLV